MVFLKRTLSAIAIFFLILLGGAGTQSNSMLLQGGGFIGLIIGLVVLYVFIKMAWRAIGCLPAIIIIFSLISFIVYAIGGFRDGVSGIIPNLQKFLGQNQSSTNNIARKHLELINEEELNNDEMIEDEASAESANHGGNYQSGHNSKEYNNQGPKTFKNIINNFGSKNQPASFNPQDYPAIYGSVKVISGDTLNMGGRNIRLFGIDAPELNQTCANRSGRSYHCGRHAANWLRNWITDYELECHIMQKDGNGNMVGVCALGQYDLGAALVNAGWAVAYTKYTKIYLPYQENAMQQRIGLWQGRFYMPWDWRAIQSKKPDIKIVRPKVERKSMWNF